MFLLVFFLESKDFEASFIRLLDKLTNGSRIEVNETGKTYVTQASALITATDNYKVLGKLFIVRIAYNKLNLKS